MGDHQFYWKQQTRESLAMIHIVLKACPLTKVINDLLD